MKTFLTFMALSMAFLSCTLQQDRLAEIDTPVEIVQASNVQETIVPEGLQLLESNCYACHNPKAASHDQMLAPPLAHIKQRYLKDFPEREAFIAQITSFVSNPSMEKAIMRGPVRRFGLMPKPAIAANEEDIKKIAAFLIDNPLEEPGWMTEHHKGKQGMKRKGKNCNGKRHSGHCGKGKHRGRM